MDPFPFTIEGFKESLYLLTERTDSNACVILADKESDNFVQFGRGPDLVLDLPLAALNAVQSQRAHKFFKDMGVEAPVEYKAPDLSDNDTVRKHQVFECNFGTDAKAASQTAIDLFYAVYGPIPLGRFRTVEQ